MTQNRSQYYFYANIISTLLIIVISVNTELRELLFSPNMKYILLLTLVNFGSIFLFLAYQIQNFKNEMSKEFYKKHKIILWFIILTFFPLYVLTIIIIPIYIFYLAVALIDQNKTVYDQSTLQIKFITIGMSYIIANSTTIFVIFAYMQSVIAF